MLQGQLSALRAPRAAAALSNVPVRLLHTRALALELLLESLITQVTTPFSCLTQSIMLALAWFTVRVHLFPGGSVLSNKSLTVPQCNQTLNQARTFGYLDTCSPEILLPYIFILMGFQKHLSDPWSPWVCSPKGSLLLIP